MPGAPSRTIRVFIIDDHRMFTQAVAAALTEEPDMEVVGTVDNLADARRELEKVEVDVIPVSYTHLDVYKRQVAPSSGWRRSAGTATRWRKRCV